MTEGGRGADGAISDVPWALLFDPAVNVRALGEIQARGFRAAADLVDRFVRVAEPSARSGRRNTTGPELGDPASETLSSTMNPDINRLVESWRTIASQLADSLRGGGPPEPRAMFDLAGGRSGSSVTIKATQPGPVSTEVWLQNEGPTDLSAIVIRCSDLLSHDGDVIDSGRIALDPQTVPMPPRCSRGICVRIEVDEHVADGVYRGTLLIGGHLDNWLPVVLTVALSAK